MKKINLTLLFAIIIFSNLFAQNEVKIGEQIWMTKNLDVDKFRNGDPIPQAKTAEEWKLAGKNHKPAWCYYNNDPNNASKYGKLYNWYAVNDKRGLAPLGCHVPHDSEWKELVNFLGGHYEKEESEIEPANKIKSKNGWGVFKSGGGTDLEYCSRCSGMGKEPDENGRYITCSACNGKGLVNVNYAAENKSGNGDNNSGFSGLPGGFRGQDGKFGGVAESSNWWSSSENYTLGSWFCVIDIKKGIRKTYAYKESGISVRCIIGEDLVQEIIPNEVIIGNQTWMTHNLNVEKFRNGDPIPQAKTAEEWKKAGNNKQPAWCYYENDKENGFKYGKLYNWYAVNDSRGLAPIGWRIPSDSEWIQLANFVNYDVSKLKSKSGWFGFGNNGNDETGFSALPAGFREDYFGEEIKFSEQSSQSCWWSSSLYKRNADFAMSNIFYKPSNEDNFKIWHKKNPKLEGLSVRCIK